MVTKVASLETETQSMSIHFCILSLPRREDFEASGNRERLIDFFTPARKACIFLQSTICANLRFNHTQKEEYPWNALESLKD